MTPRIVMTETPMEGQAGIPVLMPADVGPLASQLAVERFAELYRLHGALLLRDVVTDAFEFLALSDRFGSASVPYRLGHRRQVSLPEDKLQLANEGEFGMLPHSELCTYRCSH